MSRTAKLLAGFTFASVVVASCLIVSPARMASRSNPNSTDVKFVKEAAQGDMAEVKLAKVVVTRANSPSVKNFASMMIAEHSKSLQANRSLARKKGIMLPADISPKQKAAAARVTRERGTKFELAYKSLMIADHTANIHKSDNELKNGRDGDIKAAARKARGMFVKHLASAKAMMPGSKSSRTHKM